MQNSITVEVFRDADSPEIDTNIGVEGASFVSLATPNLEVVKDTRKLRIPGKESDTLHSGFINFPPLTSNFNILLTTKKVGSIAIQDGITKETVGFAMKLTAPDRSIAVVNVETPDPHLIVAHEIGHMLNLKYPNHSDPAHCETPFCLMCASTTSVTTSERIKKRGLDGLLERRGWRPAEYEERTTTQNTSFCDPCNDQLARKSFFLLKHLKGETIPESWR